MLKRISAGALALAGLTAAMLTGCSSTQVDSIVISPASQALTVGQTVQFTATGTVGHGQHPSSSENVTTMVTWTSSAPAVATVNASGLATAVSAGTTTITATMNGFPGVVSATATVTVTGGGGGSGNSGAKVVSLAVIPGTQSVASPTETSQFLAIGTTSAGATENLTTQVVWSSSSPQIATVGISSGLAKAVSQGTATITAIYTNSDQTVASASATFIVVGGASEPITALSIIPGSESLAASQQGQFLALGISGTTGLEQDVTQSSQLTWSSSIPSIASISATGLATGVAAGNSAITAEWKNPDGSVVSATVPLTVTNASAGLLSLKVIPSDISVGNLQGTGNFLAIGTFSTPPIIRDLTNSVTWLSSEPNYFPVNTNSNPPNPGAPGGIATAYASGSATIIAEATDPTTGSVQTATATFDCPYVAPNPSATPPVPGSCYPGSQSPGLLTTVTVYNEGNNTSNWLVTAPSATGTPKVLHCGPGWAADGNPGGSVCVATYPVGTPLTLTAPAQPGVSFGGWSSNCTPTSNPPTAAGPNHCTIISTDTNVTVGAIFN